MLFVHVKIKFSQGINQPIGVLCIYTSSLNEV